MSRIALIRRGVVLDPQGDRKNDRRSAYGTFEKFAGRLV